MEVDAENEEDFWFDMVNNELPRQQLPQEAAYEGPTCAHCNCAVPEYLVQCSQCPSRFCYRRIHGFEAEEIHLGAVPADRTETTLSSPDSVERDDFPLDEACVAFDFYETIGKRPCIEVAKKGFVCPDCWDHKSLGLYP
ncbi:hypothetical protein FRC10_004797, partial [Ceratobasidium sp. 414]